MPGRRLMTGFAALMAVLTAAYYAFPQWHIVIWTTIGAVSAAAVATGAVLNRPRRRLPWFLLAGGVFAFAMGDTAYLILTDVLGQDEPFPSLADAIYLGLFFPLAMAGLLGLARSGAANRDRAGLLDALALTSGFALITWLFLISPYVRAEDLNGLDKAISIAYPLYDVLVLAVVARLVIALRWSPTVALMGIGGLGLLVADVLYGMSRLGIGAAWLMGGPIDLGWIVFYAAVGLAALHPSMVALTDPRVPAQPGLSGRRLALLGLATLVAPAVLLVEAVRGSSRDEAIGSVVAGLMFSLVLARLYGAVNLYRGAVSRERGLREASGALVWASDAEEVATAVRVAVARLLPPGTDHRVVLALDNPTAAWPDDPQSADLAVVVPAKRANAVVGGTATAGSTEEAAADGPEQRDHAVVYTASLGPALAHQLGDIEVAARSRLVVANRASGDPHIGTLYVAADERALATLQEAIVVLASQAAIALERIALNWEIGQRRSQEYFRTLVHNTPDVILILDDDDRIRYASPSATGMFGAERLVGVSIYDPIDAPYRPVARRVLHQIRYGEERSTQDDWVVVDAAGTRIKVEATGRDLRGEPTVDGLVVTLRDVTEQRRLEHELTHRAFHDSLTGLPNRVLFQDRLKQALARAARNGTIVGVLFIDLDDFKVINDTMGHAAGDELLVAMGQRLVGALRTGDTAARFGGDEFAALVEDVRDPADVDAVAQRVTAAFARPHTIESGVVTGMASVGVATTAETSTDDDLLRQADLALYVAKGAGKGQWRRYQRALHDAFLKRLEVRADLDRAVADGQFSLRYQPIVELVTGRAVGLEALLRWNHPVRGVLAPGDFIDVAEESGLIVPIGAWVIGQALEDATTWCRQLPAADAPYVNVNVSARQFREPDFVDIVLDNLASKRFAPDRLVLEITETLLLSDDESLRNDLFRLHEAGVRLAIDDFGTGYSSLSYLRQVPADMIKIERSFIDKMSANPQQRTLVEGILRLADTLGLDVVAEGIEQEADRAVLESAGCRYGQGFLFCRPVELPDVMTWLGRTQVAA